MLAPQLQPHPIEELKSESHRVDELTTDHLYLRLTHVL